MKAVVVVVVAAAIVLAGCGSDAGLSSSARARLAPLVEQVRHAAESRDVAGTLKALAAVQDAVAADKLKGDISGAKAAQILSDVSGVSGHLDLVSSTTIATTTTPSSTTPDTRPRPRKHEGKGKGDENG
jgi:hypothetical protein